MSDAGWRLSIKTQTRRWAAIAKCRPSPDAKQGPGIRTFFSREGNLMQQMLDDLAKVAHRYEGRLSAASRIISGAASRYSESWCEAEVEIAFELSVAWRKTIRTCVWPGLKLQRCDRRLDRARRAG